MKLTNQIQKQKVMRTINNDFYPKINHFSPNKSKSRFSISKLAQMLLSKTLGSFKLKKRIQIKINKKGKKMFLIVMKCSNLQVHLLTPQQSQPKWFRFKNR